MIDDILSQVILTNPRLRQAETAFTEGRLNEAPRRVEQQGVRNHRAGQLLLTKIVDALVERSREHLRAGRLQQANVDCEETKKLAAEKPSSSELSSKTTSAKQDTQKKTVRKQPVAAEVGREIARGVLDLGEKPLRGSKRMERRLSATDTSLQHLLPTASEEAA